MYMEGVEKKAEALKGGQEKRLSQALPDSAKIHCEKNKNYCQPKSYFTHRMSHNQLHSGDFFPHILI